jgi:hypothetical protein
MRSVVVVFPASMWAMMPMLRNLSSGVRLAMSLPRVFAFSLIPPVRAQA